MQVDLTLFFRWTKNGKIFLLNMGLRLIKMRALFFGIDVPGYASLFLAVVFLGGLQLIGIGLIGEYVGRIYIESKKRPHYVIREIAELSVNTVDSPH
jgi:glycosyltransferase involved in cell wall biosynthesis